MKSPLFTTNKTSSVWHKQYLSILFVLAVIIALVGSIAVLHEHKQAIAQLQSLLQKQDKQTKQQQQHIKYSATALHKEIQVLKLKLRKQSRALNKIVSKNKKLYSSSLYKQKQRITSIQKQYDSISHALATISRKVVGLVSGVAEHNQQHTGVDKRLHNTQTAINALEQEIVKLQESLALANRRLHMQINSPKKQLNDLNPELSQFPHQ